MLTQKCKGASLALEGTRASADLSFPTFAPCLVFVASALPTVPGLRADVDRRAAAVARTREPAWVHA
jgi:hypothetical protein